MFKPVLGFRFSAVSAGIRKDGRIDLALAAATEPAVAAGVFTRNLVRAAPVEIASARVRAGQAQAILANAGCANACTGAEGHARALQAADAVAGALDLRPELVLPASTGVIGQLLPADRVVAAVPALVAGLATDGHEAFAQAICTTDRFPKLAERPLAAGKASLLGIAKGAGMIHPDMGDLPHATLLAFLFTDAVVDSATLHAALLEGVDRTFNACSVDGDTSTNDTALALASGKSGCRVDQAELTRALTEVCGELARAMVADGEGAEHVAEIRVSGLRTRDDARSVARCVATSLLVKTALFGRDANWGRLLAAAGRAGVAFDPRVARIAIGGIVIVERGAAVGGDAEQRANAVLQGPSYTIDLVLGDGAGEFSYLTSDLGHQYVDVNAGYRS